MIVVYLISMNNLVIFTVLYNKQTAKVPMGTIHIYIVISISLG